MKYLILFGALVFSTLIFAIGTDKLTEYFNNNKIGRGADFGVFKKNDDHVISVHGFVNDLEVCLEIASMLNMAEPTIYSCKPLNH